MAKLRINSIVTKKPKITGEGISRLREEAKVRKLQKLTVENQSITKTINGLKLTPEEKQETSNFLYHYFEELNRLYTEGTRVPELKEFYDVPRVAKSRAIAEALRSNSSGKGLSKIASKLGITPKDIVRAKILMTFGHPTIGISIKKLQNAGISYGEMYNYGLEVLKEPEMKKQIALKRNNRDYPMDVMKIYLTEITSLIDAERTLKQIKEVNIKEISNRDAKEIRTKLNELLEYITKDKEAIRLGTVLTDAEINKVINRVYNYYSPKDPKVLIAYRDANIPVDFLLRSGKFNINEILEVYPTDKVKKGVIDFKQWYKARKPIMTIEEIKKYNQITNA
ncbi:MAG: hypothetical protein WC932_03140 [archaeon]|jgi:hypothetical protein